MARRFFAWTTVRFAPAGTRHIRRYRRYGKKTYRTARFTIFKPKSSRRFQDYV